MSGIFSVSKSSVTKVKRLVLLVTAFLLTISLVAPILDNGSASAAKLYNTMTLDELGKSSSYYVTLQTCVSNNMYPNITAKSPFYDPVQINWFDDNTATGYVYPEGKTDCKAIMSSALELWNISPADFLKGMKYTQNTPGEYNWTGSGDGAARKNNFVSFVKSGSVTGTSDPADIGGAAAYQRYDYWWDNNCAVQKFGKYDDIKDPVLKTRIDNGVTVEANINSAARTSVTQKYGTVERTDGIKWAYLYNDTTNAAAQSKEPFDFIAYGYHTTPRMVTCQDTAAALTTYADDWVKYLDQKSLRTICENIGFTDTPGSRADDPNPRAGVFALTACISGYDNALSCNINYSGNQVLLDACKAGAEITAAEIAAGAAEMRAAESVDSASLGETSSCGVEGIGWIICPLMSFMGNILNDAFKLISDNFLRTDVRLFDTSSGTYVGWSVFRSIANIAFVIVFLIIIFSQLTSMGVTNYGVKKMLPRLVVAAILVNVSFFICQLAVDLSNVLGYSLKSIFDNIAAAVSIPTSTDASANGFGISAIVVAIMGAAVISYFALGALIPVILGALVAVLMIVLILIFRQALIVLLIVISPLAFVAFLLPNTESLFTKWRKAFVAILLIFPIVAVVFGAASLASQILLSTGPGDVTIQIAAVGAAALPFFVVPGLLKASLDGVGGIGGKLNGFASKMGGGLGKAGSKAFGNSRVGQFQQHRQGVWNSRRSKIQSGAYNGRGGNWNPLNVASKANAKINDASGIFGTRIAASGISQISEEEAKNTKASAILLNSKGLDKAGLRRELGNARDPSMRRAVVERMVAANDINGINSMVADSHNWESEQRLHLADTLAASGSRPGYIGQGALAAMRSNPGQVMDIKGLVKSAVDSNGYSAEKIATGDADELTFVADTVAAIGGATHDTIASAAQDALMDPVLGLKIGKNKVQVENISRKQAPTAGQLAGLN